MVDWCSSWWFGARLYWDEGDMEQGCFRELQFDVGMMQCDRGLVQSGGGMLKGCKVWKVGFCMVGVGCCKCY